MLTKRWVTQNMRPSGENDRFFSLNPSIASLEETIHTTNQHRFTENALLLLASNRSDMATKRFITRDERLFSADGHPSSVNVAIATKARSA